MNALIDSVSRASSVGVEDHPEIRTSPDSFPPVLGVAAGPPHAAMTRANSARTASHVLRCFKGVPPPTAEDALGTLLRSALSTSHRTPGASASGGLNAARLHVAHAHAPANTRDAHVDRASANAKAPRLEAIDAHGKER